MEYLFPDFRDITKGGDRNNDCLWSFRLTKQRRRKKKEGYESGEIKFHYKFYYCNYNNNFISSKIVSSIPLNLKRYSFPLIPTMVGKDILSLKNFFEIDPNESL